MKKTVKNYIMLRFIFLQNTGASLLYVLMAFVFVGAVASLVLNFTRKELIDSSLFVSSETARFGATAGLTLAATLLSDPQAEIPEQEISSQELMRILFMRSKGIDQNGQPLSPDESRRPKEEQSRILGNSQSFFSDENDFRFRVRIINIDFSKLSAVSEEIPGSNPPTRQLIAGENIYNSYITVQLESESIDASGSRARNLGVFQIFGYERGMIETLVPTSALYLGGGMGEINTRLHVIGNTFLRGGGSLHHGGHIFDGEFRRRGAPTTSVQTQGTNPAFLIRSTSFRGPVYFGLEHGQNPNDTRLLFESGASIFERGFGSHSDIDVNGVANSLIIGRSNDANENVGVFLNANAVTRDAPGRWNFRGNSRLQTLNNRIYGHRIWSGIVGGVNSLFNSSSVAERPSNWTSVWQHAPDNPMNLYDSLGISAQDPPSIDINLARLTVMNYRGDNYTGDMLNNIFNSAAGIANRAANNDWMVIRWSNTGGLPFNAGGQSGFSGRMVLILDNNSSSAGQFGTQFFRSAPNGNSLIVLESGASASQLGHNGLIRGLIVNRGSGDLNLMSSGSNMTVQGGIYNVGSGGLRLEGGASNRITVRYDLNVIQEIINGLPGAILVGDGNSDTISEFRPIPENINPRGPFTELWNRSF